MDILKMDELKKHRLAIIIALSLFLIGFGIRMIPSESFPGIYGFDPYNHARIIRDVIQFGSAPSHDPYAYWPEGRGYYSFSTPWHVYTSAAWYKLYALLTTGHPSFNQQSFDTFYSMVGPFYGSLAIVSLVLIGLAYRDKKAALMAGLGFIATASTLYRTIFGFSEEDPLGFMIYGLSIAVAVYAFRKKSIKWGWMAGLAFGIYAISWATSVIPLTALATFLVIEMLIDVYLKNYDEIENKVKVTLAMVIPMILPLQLFSSTRITLPLTGQVAVITAVVVGIFIDYIMVERKKINSSDAKVAHKAKIYKYAVIGILVLSAIGLILAYDDLSRTIVWLITQAPYQNSKLLNTVGEEHPVGTAGVLSTLGWMAPFYLLALVWLPIRRFIHRKQRSYDLFIWLLGIITFFLYINKAKMGYVFDTPAIALVGIVIADMMKLPRVLKEKSKITSIGKFSKAYLGIMLLVILVLGSSQISKGVVMMEQYKHSYSPQSGWIAGLDHFASMPDKDKDVFLVWWDYGDWIAWRHMKVTLDGTNSNSTKVMMTARVLSDFRGNTDQILKRHIKELKYWGITHIGIDRILITCQKWGAVTYLGDNVCIPKKELDKWNISYPPILEGPQEECNPGEVYAGCMQGVYCRPSYNQAGNQMMVCPLGRLQLTFTPQEWARMVNTKWPGYLMSVDLGQAVLKARVYARPDGYLMFFVDRTGHILPDAPANYMLGYRLFFQDPSIKDATFAGDFWGNLVTRYNYPPKYRYVPDEEVVFWKLNWNKLNETG